MPYRIIPTLIFLLVFFIGFPPVGFTQQPTDALRVADVSFPNPARPDAAAPCEFAALRFLPNEKTEELSTDDGSIEAGVYGDGLIVVNRLTPTAYPAYLTRIRIRWDTFQGQPSPVGNRVRLVVGLEPTGVGRAPVAPNLMMSDWVTIPGVGAFSEFTLTNGPALPSGDFYVGFQSPTPSGGVLVSVDTNGPQQRRAFFSTDSGATFRGPLTLSNGAPANAMIRAVVRLPESNDTTELTADDGTSDGRGLIEDGLTAVNRLTPAGYPVTVRAVRIFFVGFTNQPSPVGQPVQLVVFVDPAGTGRPPAQPAVTTQTVTIPRIGEFVDFAVPPVTVTSGDVYVGYRTAAPANGVGFAVDSNGPARERTFLSSDGGGTYRGPVRFAPDGAPINLMVRALVAPTSGGGDTQPPTVRVTAPNGGEALTVGTRTAVGWTATDDAGIAAQEIALSTDGGATFPTSIVAGLAADARQYEWTVPNQPTTRGRLRVTARDAAGNRGSDDSDGDFTIRSANLPTVIFESAEARVVESRVAELFLTRSSSEGALTVRYAVGGTARPGTEVTAMSGTATFPAGQSRFVLTVRPIDNFHSNGETTVVVTVEAGPTYQLGATRTATVTIADDDRIGTGEIGAETGGAVCTEDGAAVYVPPGSAPVTATLERIADPPRAGSGGNTQIVSGRYRATLRSRALPGQFVLVLPVREALFPDPADRLDFGARRLDARTGNWVACGRMATYDAALKTLVVTMSANEVGAATARRFAPNQIDEDLSTTVYVETRRRLEYRTYQAPGSRFIINYHPPDTQWDDRVKADKDWNGGKSCSGAAGTDAPNFVRDLSAILNEEYDRLMGLPQVALGEIALPQTVYVRDLGPDAGQSPLGGPIRLHNARLSGCQDMRETAAHELIHVFQGRFYSHAANATLAAVADSSNGWFIEAAANHYAALAANLSDDRKAAFYADPSMTDYLSIPIVTFSDNSSYSAAHFLDWLAERYAWDIVGVTLDRRATGSFYDETNLDAVIREHQDAMEEPTNQRGLGAALVEYGKFIMTHPEGTAGFNGRAKTEMMGHALQFMNVSAPVLGPIADRKQFFVTFERSLPARSLAYVTFAATNQSKALAVIDATRTGGAPLDTMTFDFVGTSDSDYDGKDPIDKTLVPFIGRVATIENFGRGAEKEDLEQLWLNGSPTGGRLNVAYYILTPPTIANVQDGAVLWTFEGVGTEKGNIPREFIKGFNVYNVKANVKLNGAPIPLPPSGLEQSFEATTIKAADRADYVVTIVDKHDNEWPKVAPLSVKISPKEASVTAGGTVEFTAVLSGVDGGVEWEATDGTFEAKSGLTARYKAPTAPGQYTVTVKSVKRPDLSDTATVLVSPPGQSFTDTRFALLYNEYYSTNIVTDISGPGLVLTRKGFLTEKTKELMSVSFDVPKPEVRVPDKILAYTVSVTGLKVEPKQPLGPDLELEIQREWTITDREGTRRKIKGGDSVILTIDKDTRYATCELALFMVIKAKNGNELYRDSSLILGAEFVPK